MMAEARTLDPVDEASREYERVVDPGYLEQIRSEAKQFSTKRFSRQFRLAKHTDLRSGKNINHGFT
jgi:hypothetical protein